MAGSQEATSSKGFNQNNSNRQTEAAKPDENAANEEPAAKSPSGEKKTPKESKGLMATGQKLISMCVKVVTPKRGAGANLKADKSQIPEDGEGANPKGKKQISADANGTNSNGGVKTDSKSGISMCFQCAPPHVSPEERANMVKKESAGLMEAKAESEASQIHMERWRTKERIMAAFNSMLIIAYACYGIIIYGMRNLEALKLLEIPESVEGDVCDAALIHDAQFWNKERIYVNHLHTAYFIMEVIAALSFFVTPKYSWSKRSPWGLIRAATLHCLTLLICIIYTLFEGIKGRIRLDSSTDDWIYVFNILYKVAFLPLFLFISRAVSEKKVDLEEKEGKLKDLETKWNHRRAKESLDKKAKEKKENEEKQKKEKEEKEKEEKQKKEKEEKEKEEKQKKEKDDKKKEEEKETKEIEKNAHILPQSLPGSTLEEFLKDESDRRKAGRDKNEDKMKNKETLTWTNECEKKSGKKRQNHPQNETAGNNELDKEGTAVGGKNGPETKLGFEEMDQIGIFPETMEAIFSPGSSSRRKFLNQPENLVTNVQNGDVIGDRNWFSKGPSLHRYRGWLEKFPGWIRDFFFWRERMRTGSFYKFQSVSRESEDAQNVSPLSYKCWGDHDQMDRTREDSGEAALMDVRGNQDTLPMDGKPNTASSREISKEETAQISAEPPESASEHGGMDGASNDDPLKSSAPSEPDAGASSPSHMPATGDPPGDGAVSISESSVAEKGPKCEEVSPLSSGGDGDVPTPDGSIWQSCDSVPEKQTAIHGNSIIAEQLKNEDVGV